MTRLMLMLFAMVGTTLMGIGVVIALTAGTGGAQHIVLGAGAGFVLAVPVSWLIARQITRSIS